MDTEPASDTTQQQENITFSDADSGQCLNIPLSIGESQIDTSASVDLGSFLSRPVEIASYTWTESFSFNQSFDPWQLYFGNPTIKRKLDNYYLLRCNLHLKFVINASPFYYSTVMCSYRPLTAFSPAPVASGVGTSSISIVGRSQRPRVFLYPQGSVGAEMVLPFFYHKNWLNATSQADLISMGRIYMDDCYFPLHNANSAVGAVTNIHVYAWAEDLTLAGPTIKLSLQGGNIIDEYATEKGPVSAPASALARFAGKLEGFPVIGPFATATSIMAGAVSSVASLFGFTNVPVIDDVHYFKGHSFPHMSTTQIGVPIEKLTLDPKNELTVDPKVNGVDLGDEMMIKNIATRESYLQTFTWTDTEVTDDLICNAVVSPAFSVAQTGGDGIYRVQGTPGWMVSNLFRYWRGDIVFRFKFLCTKFHRGRVRVTWDPVGDVGNDAISTTQVYNKIIDITNETDIEFSVPYTQLTSYLNTPPQGGLANHSRDPLTHVQGTDNGIITMRVLNAQTSPIVGANIGVLLFVRCADNIEFANPRDPPQFYDTYTPQGGKEVDYDAPSQYSMGVKPSKASQFINTIHMGETITSLRQIMRRQNYIMTQNVRPTSINAAAWMGSTIRRMPLLPGYDTDGITTATKTYSIGNAPYNYCTMSTLNWVNQCYVAHKGSVHWNINYHQLGGEDFPQVDVTRNIPLTVAGYSNEYSVPVTSADSASYIALRANKVGQTGMYLTNQKTQPGVSVAVPMYSKYKFLSNDLATRTLGSTDDETTLDSFTVSGQVFTGGAITLTDSVNIDFYCGIGTDFSSVFFLNVPTYYQQSNPPAPV